ncbi:hypothetical protein DH2020_042241 [Rehmannia glutinosa]|uniref:NAD(P)H dehydrogenase (quinone) n=1 Tax=Rehmannia glutinosa TaxID=99300 RepID=A0ABR0UMX5_REHGL
MATKVYIIYYSTYGHVEKLAQEIKKGAESVQGVEAKLWQMGAPPKSDVPVITPNELVEADGIIFGFPTRFGMMAAQFKAFFDSTGGLWRTQALAGKPAGIFTALDLKVVDKKLQRGMFEMEMIKGGSPYGAGTFAGDGSRQPSEIELAQAFHQGKYIAGITKKLKQTA